MWWNEFGCAATSATASASSAAPRPPSAKCVQTADLMPIEAASSSMAACSEGKSLGIELIATTGSTPCARTFSSCLRRLAAPVSTSSGFSLSMSSGSGRPATTLYLPECDFSARTVATTTAASGVSPDAALDVEEPLRAHVGAEPGLGDQELAGVDADQVGHHTRVAVGDVAE